ncbi:hypothetical protein [Tautonia plasticadhaerens]|uniref:Uncharacterized protein n=1 Tax=Tautonia plasticadhaerens TaxID=2527974 RepID=A0A518H095_9BACT|nr:hypothetical protein [Tautonia plasticadhaerens]QDV34260.1 hypothetical protein ElP_21450 [Tautonia plasticadhaerens]
MIWMRFGPSRVHALIVALGLSPAVVGCGGDDDGQAVQTEEMNQHLQEVTGNYGQQYAEQYSKKGQ